MITTLNDDTGLSKVPHQEIKSSRKRAKWHTAQGIHWVHVCHVDGRACSFRFAVSHPPHSRGEGVKQVPHWHTFLIQNISQCEVFVCLFSSPFDIERSHFLIYRLKYFKHNNSIILQIVYPFTNGSAVSVKVKFLNCQVNSLSFCHIYIILNKYLT